MPHDNTSEQYHALEMDLTQDEARRRAEVVAALGDDWDPVAVIKGEEEAYRLLYSGLDEEQAAVHRDLVAAGVLPPLPEDDSAAT